MGRWKLKGVDFELFSMEFRGWGSVLVDIGGGEKSDFYYLRLEV